MRYEGYTVFVTGGSNGIGAAIAKAYMAEGAKVMVADLEPCDFADGFIQADLSQPADVQRAMRKLFDDCGDIDILINNVGVMQNGTLFETDPEDFIKVINTNLTSAFITSRAFAEHRRENKAKRGAIINIASTRHLMSEPNTEAYSASKGGVVSLTHALAATLEEYNITVNCISPGWIENYAYDSLRPEDHSQHLTGRVGKPSDIAQACLFLTDPENDFIDGVDIVVDGGMTHKMIYL